MPKDPSICVWVCTHLFRLASERETRQAKKLEQCAARCLLWVSTHATEIAAEPSLYTLPAVLWWTVRCKAEALRLGCVSMCAEMGYVPPGAHCGP